MSRLKALALALIALAAAAPAPDAEKASPKVVKLRFANERVRVLETVSNPGDRVQQMNAGSQGPAGPELRFRGRLLSRTPAGLGGGSPLAGR